MGIETTAHFDEKTDEFIINTPNELAQKAWIGGTADDAKITVVFAQTYIKGKNQGIHIFLVRLRDDQHKLMKGVRIKDHGAKMGMNGVDNGRIWFEKYRVPREALLDKYCSVTKEGVYSSPIKSPTVRFATMICTWTCGERIVWY
jgi:acyl-CoA oxidase